MNSSNRTLIITQDKEVLYRIKLDDSYENIIEVDDGDHLNIIHIEKGEVWVEQANCFNQVCVKERPISKSNQVIVCLPHKLIIEIVGEDDGAVDIIVD